VDRAAVSGSEGQGFDSLHAYGILDLGLILVSTFKSIFYMMQVEACILRKNVHFKKLKANTSLSVFSKFANFRFAV
jgi:hypothetical protein